MEAPSGAVGPSVLDGAGRSKSLTVVSDVDAHWRDVVALSGQRADALDTAAKDLVQAPGRLQEMVEGVAGLIGSVRFGRVADQFVDQHRLWDWII